MNDDNDDLFVDNPYDFDPTYNYSLEQLLQISPPREAKNYLAFWQNKYESTLRLTPQTVLHDRNDERGDWRIFDLSYSSTERFPIRGWLLIPKKGQVKRGFIIGHGYGGRDEPDLHLPFNDAVLFFPCFRGLSLSKKSPISSDPFWHVRHDIDKKDQYILGGCVEDLWMAVTALLRLFPQLEGHLGYLGISFGGGIGAMAMAMENRISRCHLNVPSFGHHSLRLKLKTLGSADSVQKVYMNAKKSTLKTLRYYDAAISAKYIKMPMHCALAKFDPVVAPPGQFAIYNALPNRKQLFVLDAGHYDYPNKKIQEIELLQELSRFFQPLLD